MLFHEKIFLLLFLFALTFCKTEKRIGIITSKTIAIISEIKGCRECTENTMDCCVMRYGGKRYIRNQTFVFDSTGKATKVLDYIIAPQLGHIIYESANMPPDLEIYYQIKKQQVQWVAGKEILIDNNDTIKAFEILPEQHVIIADGSQYSQGLIAKGNVVVYTYR